MNGLERITSRIEAEARGEIDSLLGTAKQEAERITQDFRTRAETEARALAAKNEKNAEEREARLVSAAQMDAQKQLLAVKQELVEETYRLALDKLCSMPEEKETAFLARLLAQASTTGMEEAVFSAKDRERIGAKAVRRANESTGKKLTLSEQTAPIRGGFILRDKNVEVNCTYETLLRLEKAQTAGATAKLLFP